LPRKALIPSLSPVRYFGVDDMLAGDGTSEAATVDRQSRELNEVYCVEWIVVGVDGSAGQKIKVVWDRSAGILDLRSAGPETRMTVRTRSIESEARSARGAKNNLH
jgi:hypothetical protein